MNDVAVPPDSNRSPGLLLGGRHGSFWVPTDGHPIFKYGIVISILIH